MDHTNSFSLSLFLVMSFLSGSGTPISCLPDKKPLFVGRELECDAVLNPLVSGDSRLVNIWGPPGFGKTSVAIEVAHHLRGRNTPTYFISVRGVKSKEEIVSKLLSIFAGTNKQATHFSPFHTVIQCLREFRDPFVVIFDNADDVLESGNGPLRDDMLQVTQEILEQCNLVRLLFTTRESMDYLHHSVAITVVKVEEMDEVSSSELVRLLLPDVQDDDCKRVVRACGRVPLAMKLMCGIIKEENSSATKLCKELRIIPVVAVLDDERLPNDLRLRNIIDKSYERLAIDERRSFVSLAVFPGFFGKKEATSVLRARDTRVTTRFLKSLQQKSLINYHDHRESFSIHPLLQSFIAEKCSKDDEIRNAFNEAQLRLHEYYVSCFAEANEQFLTGNSVEAFAAFRSQQDGIMSSLAHGTRSEALYRQVIDSISTGELFLYSLLCHEEFLFHDLYDTALKEAKKQGNLCDEYALKAAKAFGHLGWFFARSQVWDESAQPWTGKMLCYRSVYQLLCGNLDEGVSSLEIAVDLLSSGRCDEQILKILANHILAVYYTTKEDEERIAYFENLCRVESLKSVSSSRAIRYLFSMMSHPVEEIDQSAELSSVAEQDATMFALIAKLLPSLYKVFANPEVQRKATLMTTSLLKQYEILKRLFENGALPFQVLESCCDALRIMNFAKEAAQGFQVITHYLDKENRNRRDAARNFHFLGLAHEKAENRTAALDCFKKALEIRVQLLRDDFDWSHSSDDNVVGEAFDSLLGCLEIRVKISEELQSPNTCSLSDLKHTCEFLGSILKSLENVSVGLSKLELARNLDSLGHCQVLLKHFQGAAESYDLAVRMREEKAEDHVQTAFSLMRLGCVLFQLGRNTEAENALQRSLNVRTKLRLDDDLDTASVYYQIGENYLIMENFPKARDAHSQGLELRMKHLGEDVLTAASFERVGITYLKMSDYKSALQPFQNALQMRKNLLGDHLDTASSYHNLSLTYLKSENCSEALTLCQQALSIRLGLIPGHEETATSFHLQGSIYCQMGDLVMAREAFLSALDLRKNILGAHRETALTYHCLGEAQYKMGDYSEALDSLLEAQKFRRDLLGDHPATATTLELLARTYEALGAEHLAHDSLLRAGAMREELRRMTLDPLTTNEDT